MLLPVGLGELGKSTVCAINNEDFFLMGSNQFAGRLPPRESMSKRAIYTLTVVTFLSSDLIKRDVSFVAQDIEM
jgi:hypothetical protein